MLEQNFEKTTDIVKRANANEQAIITTPTMLTPQEQMLLYLLAKEYYSGEGAIFDAGICLGGCTESFARGLAARDTLPPISPIIHAYELGIADEDYVTQFIFNAYGEERHKGDSFVDIIQKNIDGMPCRDVIQFFPGDILLKPYPETIEIMFLDVCKLQNINFKMQKLFARLIPGKSIVLQQDYVHAWHPYIHTTMGYLADYFEPIGPTWYSTFPFILKKSIPESVLSIDVYAEKPVSELEKYIERYYSYFDPVRRGHLETTRAFLLYEKGEYGRCYEILKSLNGVATHWDFKYTCDYLCDKMGMQPFETVEPQKEPPSKLRKWLVRTPILGPLLAKCCNMTDK